MKTFKKLGEDIRHTVQVTSNNIKHKTGAVDDNIYEAKEALETIRHVGNEAHIDHPNNPFVNVFNEAVEKVDEAVDAIGEAITDFFEHFCC